MRARPVEPSRGGPGRGALLNPAAERRMAGSGLWRRMPPSTPNGGHHAEVQDPEAQRRPTRHCLFCAPRQDGLAVLPEGLQAAPVKKAVAKLTSLGFLKEVRVKHD